MKLNEESKDKSNELDEFGERRYNIFIDEIVRLSMDRHCFSEHEMLVQAFTMMAGVSNSVDVEFTCLVRQQF